MSATLKFLLRRRLAPLAMMFFATNIQAHDLSEHVLKVPVNPFPPWVHEHAGNVVGIDIEILDLIAEKLSFQYEPVVCPFARCLKLLEQGNADFMIGLFRTAERASYLRFIQPGYLKDDPKAFYVLESSKAQVDRYEDLSSLRIGVVRGTSYFERFDKDNTLRKMDVSDDLQLLKMLNVGRIDTFVGTPSHINYLMRQNGFEGIREARFKEYADAYSFAAISRNSELQHHLEEFNAKIAEMVKDGSIDSLVEKYR